MQCVCTILSSVAYPSLHYFSTLSLKRHDFRKKVIEHKMCVLILSTNVTEKFLFLRRTEEDVSKSIYWYSCNVPFFLTDFSESWFFSTNFRKIRQYKICPVEAELFHVERRTDGQTDRQTDEQTDRHKRKVTVVFRKFENKPKNDTRSFSLIQVRS